MYKLYMYIHTYSIEKCIDAYHIFTSMYTQYMYIQYVCMHVYMYITSCLSCVQS